MEFDIALLTPNFFPFFLKATLSKGTHTMITSFLFSWQLAWATDYDQDVGMYKYNSGRGFYKGEKVDEDSAYAGFLTNKKWHLNEVAI